MSLRSTNAVLVPSPPKLGSPRRAHSCSEPDADSRAPNKRRRLSEIPKTNEELVLALTGASRRPRGRPRDLNNVPLTATHEIRKLRAQVASMEGELQGLQSKWSDQLPEDRTLSTARRSAQEKHAADLAERAHKELQQLLRQQQLMFATLQTAVLHAPLHSNGNDMFKALHFDTQLGSDPQQREKGLAAHNERSLATLPSIVDKFSQMAIDKALEGHDAADKSVMPLSQINITGGKDCTLISSVFISEIPHTSLDEVYAAVLAYFDAIPASMKRHFGVEANRTRLNDAESTVVYRRSTFNGSGVPVTVNNIVCSELTASHGMVHIDAVTDDPLHPVPESASSQYGICGLTITPRKEPVTGKTLSITLRWVVVYRYNMLPHESAI
ncbi:hypothetical protein PF005_g12232 [Phytophthora fragariae]|uniref:START domain-containing protein n=1 Tax=Phytophthora fragariae TaxID=53985 RepID=A0A6A3S3B2_9STRA|nr:hypothetical protein PF003_g23724 [Phytophthora fragariae]KAE8936710.1 hypothetical protein PF009_g13373 [Phytophthora fragariae]KAE9007311.1 hypothetical protein PF011_g11183 [Phytophthora fragariae]KAE9108944.1 hypothetical protein PF010_g11726 [Phytophthora fragariae]KAE9108981.1 hypothetical protein PF007_g12439 [Phytophthora fragariae]